MRDYLVRGYSVEKLVSESQWISDAYGVDVIEYVDGKESVYIDAHHGIYLVYKESIGQYIGLKDMDDKKIFEGDIVQAAHRINEEYTDKYIVHFLNGCFMFGNWNAHEFFNRHTRIKVIGNTFEKQLAQK